MTKRDTDIDPERAEEVALFLSALDAAGAHPEQRNAVLEELMRHRLDLHEAIGALFAIAGEKLN